MATKEAAAVAHSAASTEIVSSVFMPQLFIHTYTYNLHTHTIS